MKTEKNGGDGQERIEWILRVRRSGSAQFRLVSLTLDSAIPIDLWCQLDHEKMFQFVGKSQRTLHRALVCFGLGRFV